MTSRDWLTLTLFFFPIFSVKPSDNCAIILYKIEFINERIFYGVFDLIGVGVHISVCVSTSIFVTTLSSITITKIVRAM